MTIPFDKSSRVGNTFTPPTRKDSELLRLKSKVSYSFFFPCHQHNVFLKDESSFMFLMLNLFDQTIVLQEPPTHLIQRFRVKSSLLVGLPIQ